MKARAVARAGADRPRRRPAPIGGPAGRAALLLVLALALSASLASRAVAAVPEVTPPPIIGPVEAIPPAAPDLPRHEQGLASKGAHKAGAGGKAGKRDQRSGAKRANDALALTASCAPFSHVQTYLAWGPAVAYGEPVTVVYDAGRCSTPDGSALDLAVEGTAKVFQGESAVGILLDTRPFLVTGTWRRPTNAEAWPPAWWACGVPYASYMWEIPGVYSFHVSARDGLWSLDVTSQGVGSQAVSWTHDGCA